MSNESSLVGPITGNEQDWSGAQAWAPYSLIGNNLSTLASAAPLSTNIILGTPIFTDTTGTTGMQQTFGINNYYQQVVQNSMLGVSASADYVVCNDLGTATANYADFGINSSGFVGTGAINIAGGAYLYNQSGPLSVGTFSAQPFYLFVNNTAAITISGAGLVNITGSLTVTSINNTPIGNVTPSTGAFTTLSAISNATITGSTSTIQILFTGTEVGAPVGSIGFGAANGITFIGKTGSTYDMYFGNGAGSAFIRNPTGTQNAEVVGGLIVDGTSTLAGNVEIGGSAFIGSYIFSVHLATNNNFITQQSAGGVSMSAYNDALTTANPWTFQGSTFTVATGTTGGTTALTIDTSQNATFGGQLTVHDALLHRTLTTLTNNAGATSPTLGAAGPTGATTPTKWIPINDNGTTRNIPAW
jgi:hypothetical protein